MKRNLWDFQIKRLFVYLFFAMIAGLVFHRYGLLREVPLMSLSVVSALGIYIYILRKNRQRDTISSMIFFLMIIILFTAIAYKLYGFHLAKNPLGAFDKQEFALEVYVERVKEREFAMDYEVLSQSIDIDGENISFRERQTLRVYGEDQGFDKGDKIRISNPTVQALNHENGEVTSYELYLKSRGIHNRLQSGSSAVELLVKEAFYHEGFIAGNPQRALDFLDYSLQEPQNQLMKSVMFGNQGFLDEDLRVAFSQTGTAHIIAVSGLHVGILVIIFMMFFKCLGMSKKIYLWLILGILFWYGYLIGYPISMVRAGMMYGLYVLAFYENRPYDGLHALGVVGVISLLINPLTLFTVSFQLSFAATGSILLLYKKIEKCLDFLPEFLRGLLSVTLSAQFGTLPLMVYYFGQISIISIFANLLLMPTMGLLLSLGLIGVFLSFLSLSLGMAVNVLTNGLLTYQIALIRFLQKIPGAYIEVSSVHFLWVVVYYIIMIGTYLYFLISVSFYRKEDF